MKKWKIVEKYTGRVAVQSIEAETSRKAMNKAQREKLLRHINADYYCFPITK
jgi:hypothetical protein